jgi:transcriptional regulator with XRE-family HTH domain
MNTINFVSPNDVPVEALRSVIELNATQRDLVRAYLECSDDLQCVVRSMFAVLDSEVAEEEDRHRALTTIADALFLNPHKKRYGMDLTTSETEAAEVDTALAREVRHMDQEEATFAERLRELLLRKRVSQTELAERTGCSQSAISHMLNRNSRPQKKTILKLAEALQIDPVVLWPDLEVADILDAVVSFQEERQLTPPEADSLREALDRPPAKVKARRLPSRPQNR